MDKYEFKLQSALDTAIKELITPKSTHKVVRGKDIVIDKVIRTFLSTKINIEQGELLSGEVITMEFVGSINLEENCDDGTTNRDVEFEIKPGKFKFVRVTKTFEIIDIIKFQFISRNRFFY